MSKLTIKSKKPQYSEEQIREVKEAFNVFEVIKKED